MEKTFRQLPDDCVAEKVASPIGDLVVIGNDDGVHMVLWKEQPNEEPYVSRLTKFPKAKTGSPVKQAGKELKEYFRGKRETFDVPVVLRGTDFQQKAWKALQKIPYGKTRTYQQQAVKVGGPEKARAVGMANGKNPIPIIVPCHRVIGKDGSLTGFGGGLETKRYLLELESCDLFEMVSD
ncbi:MAG: methylated-DNA--[protein]-cysteine S-methyltransferase [Planctomycetota bacterium]